MKIEFDSKTALITGSTGGIGYGIAKGLRAAGADVIINGRKQDTVDAAINVAETRRGSLIERAAGVTEVANVVVYTASKEASAPTGATLRVDGGIVNSIC